MNELSNNSQTFKSLAKGRNNHMNSQQLRAEEGNRKELRSHTLIEKIRKEVETMKKLGLSTEQNFLFSEYKDKSGKTTSYTFYINKYCSEEDTKKLNKCMAHLFGISLWRTYSE